MAWTRDARGSICPSLHWLAGCFQVALCHLPHPQLFWTERAPLVCLSKSHGLQAIGKETPVTDLGSQELEFR